MRVARVLVAVAALLLTFLYRKLQPLVEGPVIS